MNNNKKKGGKKRNSKNGKHQKNQFKFMASETSNMTSRIFLWKFSKKP